MQTSPLVSLITPCYNGEKYLKRFLDSLLSQTYDEVEFFFINDGSTDFTEEIFLSYKQKLEQKGWKVIYYKQSNRGPAHALNYGLKRFSGVYLACPDSDDILYPDFISVKVAFMEEHPQCALCYCGVDVVEEKDILKITRSIERCPSEDDNLFIDCLLGQNSSISAPALTYFFRAKDWIETNKRRQILDKTFVGQNWQLLLPIVYKRRCGYINKRLAKYVQRENSHSHIKNLLPLEKRVYMEKNLLCNVLRDMEIPQEELNKYVKLVEGKYRRKIFAQRLRKIPCLYTIVNSLYQFIKRLSIKT